MRMSLSIVPLLTVSALVAQEPGTVAFSGKVIRPGDSSCPLRVSGPGSSVKPGAPGEDGLRTGTMDGGAGLLVGLKLTGEDAPIEIRIDLDRDGKLDGETPLSAQPTKSEVPSNQGTTTIVTWKPEGEVEIGSSIYQVSVTTPAGKDQPTISFRCTGTSFLHARGEIDQIGYHAVVVDWDGDAVLGSKGDYWRVVGDHHLEAITAKKRPLTRDSMIEAFEPTYIEGGEVLHLAKASPEGGLELRRQPAEDTIEDYLHRRNERVAERWKHLFDTQFVTQFGEPDRPKTETPIEWIHALDLAEARALGESLGKPVFADFETDWCTWCKVLDELTYPDAEVAAYVNENFVPVKINVELLVTPLDKDYGVSGYPSMPVLAPDGSKVDMIVGYSKPSAFLQRLTDARKKYDEYASKTRAGGD